MRQARPQTSSQATDGRMRALIADDDMTLRRLMRLALEGDGWHVDEAEDGQ